jgi:hypothetical protein
MAHLGYPPFFLTFLGVSKILAAITIVAPGFPRLKEWAYAGMMFDIIGAATSRAVMGDPAVTVVIPFVIAPLVIISWALRPRDRRLQSTRPPTSVPGAQRAG